MAFKIVCDGKLCKNEAASKDAIGWQTVSINDISTSLIVSKHLCPTCFNGLFDTSGE